MSNVRQHEAMLESLAQLRNARRKAFFGTRPMWHEHAAITHEALELVSKNLGVPLPPDLASFLLELGYGDINDELSFRQDWFALVDRGQLVGHIIFAMDDRGNLYTADPNSGAIHYLERFEPGYRLLAPSFCEFLREVAVRKFEVVAWAESQSLTPYERVA